MKKSEHRGSSVRSAQRLRRRPNRAADLDQNSDRIVLSERDTDLVLRLLENPSAPTTAVLKAAARYRNR